MYIQNFLKKLLRYNTRGEFYKVADHRNVACGKKKRLEKLPLSCLENVFRYLFGITNVGVSMLIARRKETFVCKFNWV